VTTGPRRTAGGQVAGLGGGGEERVAAVEKLIARIVRDMLDEDVAAASPLMAAGVVSALHRCDSP